MLSPSRSKGTQRSVRVPIRREISWDSGSSSPSAESTSRKWTGTLSMTARPPMKFRLMARLCRPSGIDPRWAAERSSSPSRNCTIASSASQSSQALSTMAFSTGCTSVGEEAITFRMFALPVWYRSASSRSWVLACTSSNRRTLPSAITAWSAKVCRRAICLSVNGLTSVRRSTNAPMLSPSRNSGTLTMLRWPIDLANSRPSGNSLLLCEQVGDVHGRLVEKARPAVQWRLIGHFAKLMRDWAVMRAEQQMIALLQKSDGIIGLAQLAGAFDDRLQTGPTSVGEEAMTPECCRWRSGR